MIYVFLTFGICSIVAFGIVIIMAANDDIDESIATSKILLVCLLGAALSFPYYQKYGVVEKKQVEANEALWRIPKKISEADGCSVYSFYDHNRYHYFTRCSANVTITSDQSHKHGKVTVNETESISTEIK